MKERPTRALINLENLKANFLSIKALTEGSAQVMAVVKADAYGHGDKVISKALEENGCDQFGVAMLEEGIRLREAGLKKPIVVLGGLLPGQGPDFFNFDLTPVIYDLSTARRIDRIAGEIETRKKVHVKIDTGMGRLGILPQEVDEFFAEFKELTNIELEGLMSHYADMEVEDKTFSRGQLDRFLEVIEVVRSMGFTPKFTHMSNSAAIVDFKESHMDMIRAGLMLYGVYPAARFEDKIKLKPVMELHTQIICIKKIPKGSSVSYGRTFVAERDSLIATISAGYADGIPRRLSNKGTALVRGSRAPIAGTVCMDMTMLDVTDVDGVEVGDSVVLIGAQGTEEITALQVADLVGTIPYEILCNIGARVPRVVTKDMPKNTPKDTVGK
ncbi:MAG: alanine racemase [Thermodesulfobacteriota bacterium]